MKTYGLVGYPLGHSFSRDFFNKKFQAEGTDAQYVNFEIPDITIFPLVIDNTAELSGLNVTIPYKEQVIPYLTDMDARAQAIGAVNVVKILRNDQGRVVGLKGYNTDIIGFTQAIRPFLRKHHRQALILGTGGASKAVCHGLRDLGIDATFVSRHPQNGQLTYQQLTPEVMQRHTVIVNATPLGTYPNADACPDIPYHLLTEDHLCYDLVYNPETTKFMSLSAAHGATVQNGLAMLHNQALAAWEIWHM